MQSKQESPLPFEQEFKATQSKICNYFLVVNAILMVPVLVVSLLRVGDVGWQPGLMPQYVAVAVAILLAIFRNRISYNVRATSIVAALSLIGLFAMWSSGFVSEGGAVLLLVPVLVTVFFDTRTAVYTVIVIFLASAVIGADIVMSGRLPAFDLATYVTSPTIWVFTLVVRAIIALALVLTIGAVARFLFKSLAHAQSDAEALRKSEERFALAMRGANDGLWDVDLLTREVYFSPRWYEMLGFEPGELPAELDTFIDLVSPEEIEQVRALAADCIAGTSDSFNVEFRMRHKDGSWRNILSRAFTEYENGVATRLVGTHVDITERKKLESQVRQIQKMDAVSQLTGGVAHDFNNLLAVIMGNAELLREVLEQKSEPNTEDDLVVAILKAAGHGAELTQRLLAFSRQQPLRPQEVDTAKLIASVARFLGQTLDDTIEVETHINADVWHARADAGQLENAILNLAFNGRDAMPEGGQLTISASNESVKKPDPAELPGLETGEYLVITVTDTGKGMAADVRGQAFEPFFTTKDVGKGSGLGLSMVYGFARQSGGSVSLSTEENKGTTMKMYLPRANEFKSKPVAETPVKTRAGGETILLLEDDASVLKLVVKTLEGLGYKVVEAVTAAAARTLLESGEPIDLILSDIVLPGGTSGPEFVAEVCALHPDMKVIFMSGYSEEVVKNKGLFSGDIPLLNKPFKRAELARALDSAFS